MECEQINPIGDDGFSDWISPKMIGYLMQCCDCKLIHEVDFQVVKYIGEPNENGLSECEIIEDKDYQVNMRVRRADVHGS